MDENSRTFDFNEKKVLIVTELDEDLKSWKELFSKLGVKEDHLVHSSTASDAINAIGGQDIDIVLCSFELELGSPVEVLEDHYRLHPNRKDYFFFLSSQTSCPAIAAFAAEHGIDNVFIKPFNQEAILDEINKSVEEKMTLSEERILFHDIQALISEKKFDDASAKLESASFGESLAGAGQYLSGLLYLKQGEIENGINSLKESIENDSEYFHSYCSLFDALVEEKEYQEAYSYVQALCEKFPLNPERIPDLIRVSLATQNYENIINFCEIILSIENSFKSLKKPLSAGLALSGKYLAEVEGMEDSAVKAAVHASDLSEVNSPIMYTALQTLIDLMKFAEVKKVLDEIPTEQMEKELVDIELSLITKTESGEFVDSKIEEYMSNEKLSAEVYKVALLRSVEQGKDEGYLNELIEKASNEFPDHTDVFEQYRNEVA